MPFHVVPVLDLKEGRAVHAIGGCREHYQPIRSQFIANSEPIPLACALRDELGLTVLYLADLDAIAGRPPVLGLYRELMALGWELWVDAGLRDAASAAPFLDEAQRGCKTVVGLETVIGPAEVDGIIDQGGADRTIFSLDLFEGCLWIRGDRAWKTNDPRVLAHEVIERGLHRLIILDLARVGTGRGLGTERLMAQILEDHPHVEIFLGGGISRIEEVIHLKEAGAAGVLIGSALHDGRIGRRELDALDRTAPIT
jgi:phosphoribosylformimino-5-aminoimidazole carboxamide ribotide isomerase